MPSNMSPEIQAAFARRQQGQTPTPALNQMTPGAANAPQMPQPTPQSQMTQASAPQGSPTGTAPQTPKFEPTNAHELVVSALVEEMKNNTKLEKEKLKLAQAAPQPSPQSTPPMGGGFSLSPGFQQPMAVNQMQGNYQGGMGRDYSGMNNYGKGTF